MFRAVFESLEERCHLSAAFDLIGLSAMRSDSTFASLNGAGMSVAVIDTGLDYTHTLLAPNYRAGADLVSGGNVPTVVDPHGTHVAGIIGATDPDIGVAPAVGLIGLQVFQRLNDGSVVAYDRDINDALQWVIDHRSTYNIVAVNMSLGSGFYRSVDDAGPSTTLNLIRELETDGVTVVSAAGNGYKGHEYQNSSAPGVYSTLDVGAVWQDGSIGSASWSGGATDYSTGADRVVSFSQRPAGSVSTIFAPGALILSTFPNNSYESEAGTSMASPMVAGAVALVQQAALHFGGSYLTPAEVRQTLINSADRIYDGDDENDNVLNTNAWYPRLNIYNAVKKVKSMFEIIAPPPPGGGESDVNGTTAGAIAGPTLDGSPAGSLAESIGTDGGVRNIGAKDVDIFRIRVATAGTLTVDLAARAGGASFDSYLRLFDQYGNEVAHNDNKAAGELYSRLSCAVQSGTYFVGVSGAPNRAYNPIVGSGGVDGATGDYVLSFALSNSDPNGVMSGAVNVTLGNDRQPAMFNGHIGTDYGQPVSTADVDLFKVVAPESGVLSIDVDLPWYSSLDSLLRVFDEDGNEILFSDDDSAPDENVQSTLESYLEVAVMRGQTYYVGVSSFDNDNYDPTTLLYRPAPGNGGYFTLRVSFASEDLDGTITQAANAFALALPASGIEGNIGYDYDGELVEVGPRDVDFYKIIPASGGVLRVDVDAFSSSVVGPVDAVLTLWDADGNRLARNDDYNGSLDPLLSYSVTAGAVYYVSVSGFGNNGFDPFASGSGTDGRTGNYLLNAQLLPISTVSSLGDGAIGQGGIQDLALDGIGAGFIGRDDALAVGATDIDLWRFIATSSGSVRFSTITSAEDSADTFLRIFDAAGNEIAWNDNASAGTVASSAVVGVVAGQTYYIGVSGTSADPRAYDPRTGLGAAAGSQGSYQLTAAAVPALPMITIGDATVVEGGTATILVKLSEAQQQPVTVRYFSGGGSAAADVDYSSISGTITFEAGVTEQIITLGTLDDALSENDETVRVQLADAAGASLAQAFGTVTITDDDAMPTVSVSDASALEGTRVGGTIEFRVALSGPSGRPVVVNYSTANITAGRRDFQAVVSSITFAPGEMEKTIAVQIFGDRVYEADEKFAMVLTGTEGAQIERGRAIGTIVNDDAGPRLHVLRLLSSRASELKSGAAISFGYALPGGYGASRYFRIVNSGKRALSISSIRLPKSFVLLQRPAKSIAPGGSAMFRVGLGTRKAGTFGGPILIYTNDPASSPFRINVSGTVRAWKQSSGQISRGGLSSAVKAGQDVLDLRLSATARKQLAKRLGTARRIRR